MTKIIKIDGMTCSHCSSHVGKALSELSGVLSVNVSLEDKCATVECGDELSNDALNDAVYNAGFDVVSIENK